MEKIVEYHGKPLEYWKENANEDYITTPISVLKYITILEESILKSSQDNKAISDMCDKLAEAARSVVKEATGVYCHYNNIVSEKESIDFEKLKNLSFLISKLEYKKLKGGKDGQ